MVKKVEKTEEQWREQLSDEEYRVTRQAGTEPPFSGIYADHKENGDYHCLCCDQKLFASTDKFNSGCGWPSFSNQLEQGNITHHVDQSHGMDRTEVRCKHCDAHLGHVFDDGPEPTGLRYCINSVSINFHDK